MSDAFVEQAELAFLDLLTRRARVAITAQLATYYSTLAIPAPSLPLLCRRLERRGLLCQARFHLALPSCTCPLVIWQEGDPSPDFGAVSWRLMNRFADSTPCHQAVFWASKRAEWLTGGIGGPLRQPNQINHDLGTTAIFLDLLLREPQTAPLWVGEDLLRRDHRRLFPSKIPDAALIDGDKILRVIETGGQYGVPRLKAFHRYFGERKKVTYELW